MPPLPWFKFYGRRWLDNKELRRCSPASRAVLVDLMALAHEGEPYGYLADKVGPLTEQYMASRCVLSPAKFRHALDELKNHDRIKQDDAGRLFIEQMVSEEEVREKRAAGGSRGGNPQLLNRDNTREVDRKVNLPPNLLIEKEDNAHSRARTRALSVSLYSFSEFFAAFPEKSSRAKMQQAWDDVVHPEAVDLVKSCMERYLASDRVARGVVQAGDRWLREQAENGWQGDWPRAESQRKRYAIAEVPEANPRDEIAAIRSLLDDENESETVKETLRIRLAELDRESA